MFRLYLFPQRVGFSIAVIALLCQVIGLGAPYWEHGAVPMLSRTYTAGLWQICSSSTDSTVCCTYKKVPTFLKVVRAMESLGVAGALLVAILFSIRAFIQKETSRSGVAVSLVCISVLSAIFIAIGLIVVAVKKKDMEKDIVEISTSMSMTIYWAGFVTIGACIAMVAVAVFAVIDLVLIHKTRI